MAIDRRSPFSPAPHSSSGAAEAEREREGDLIPSHLGPYTAQQIVYSLDRAPPAYVRCDTSARNSAIQVVMSDPAPSSSPASIMLAKMSRFNGPQYNVDLSESTYTNGTNPSTPTDPFLVTKEDLKPMTRFLKVTKSGERVPVTLRWMQWDVTVSVRLAIPPIGSTTTYLYGIEYDDAARGKHEGVYEGKQLFEPRQKGKGAGAFLLSPKDLRRGSTFAEALSERYGVDIPGSPRVVKPAEGEKAVVGEKGITLGSTGIVVQAPGIEEVQKRLGKLGRLQSIGLEGYNVCKLGGNDETKAFLRENLTCESYMLVPKALSLMCSTDDTRRVQ